MAELVKIINIQRSAPKRKFGTHMQLKAFEKAKAEGKMGPEWILESELQEIKEEIIDDGLGNRTTEVVDLGEDNISVGTETNYELMSITELKAECDSKGIKYHHANKEVKLIALLRA